MQQPQLGEAECFDRKNGCATWQVEGKGGVGLVMIVAVGCMVFVVVWSALVDDVLITIYRGRNWSSFV